MNPTLASLGLSREAIARMTGVKIEPPKPVAERKPQKRHAHPTRWLRSWVYRQPVGKRWTAKQIAEERGARLDYVQDQLAMLIARGEVAKLSGARGPYRHVWIRTEAKATWGWQRPAAIMASISADKAGTLYDWSTKPEARQGAWRQALVKARRKKLVEIHKRADREPTVYWRVKP